MKKYIAKIGIVVSLAIIPTILLAQVSTQSTEFPNPLGDATLISFLNDLIDLIITIAVPIIVLAIIFAGFKFVTAQGKPEDINTARHIIWWVVIGALIILGAKVLAAAIEGTVNDIRTGEFPETPSIVIEIDNSIDS